MWSRALEARKPRKPITLLDVVLRDDPGDKKLEDYEDPEIVVKRVEARAREEQKRAGTIKNAKAVGSERHYAKTVHREADLLHHSGDYEAALILYHRAASANPRELSHSVAARRTEAAISTATDPSRALKKLPPGAKNTSQLGANFCPETAALRANKIVEQSTDPILSIHQILKNFDSWKDFRQGPPTFQDRRRTTMVSRLIITQRKLSGLASDTLKDLKVAFASRDLNRCMKIGDKLLVISEALPNPYRYQVIARHYLAMTQIALGRHDLAVDQVSWMVRLAKASGNVYLRSISMKTLGRVHLSFRHFDAAARAWERLVLDIHEAIPKAWLLHEIGRCYFEMKRHAKALETAGRCIEYADEGNSRKWLMHGKLLSGQALVELGRFGEAVGALKVAASAASEEEDFETHEYVSNLIERVTTELRRSVFSDECVEWDAKPVNDFTRRAKSDDSLICTKQEEWPGVADEKKSLARSSIQKSKISSTRACTKKTKSPQVASIKTARSKSQRGRRNIVKRGNRRPSISPPRGYCTFDPGTTEEDINPLESATPRITPSERYPHEADLSLAHLPVDFDEAGDGELTSRTRVIRKESKEDGNSTEKCLDESKIVVHQESSSGLDDEQSNRTGKTYVIVELRNFAEDQSGLSGNDKNLEVHIENHFSNKTEIIHELDNSNNAEYLLDEKMDDHVIYSERACLYDEGIDEEEEDAENEKEEASTLNHPEVFSSCESKFSEASTAKTYIVDEKRTTSLWEMPSCYVDYEETMRSEIKHDSPTPSQSHLQRQLNARITGDDTGTTDESMRNTDITAYNNLKRVANLLANETSAQSQQEFISSSPTSLFGEHCEMDSPEIPGLLENHLPTRKSIFSPGNDGIVLATGQQRSLYRHSLPTSPRKELRPQSP